MNLIITGGNTDFFASLKLFVKSLRENAGYKDAVVVCDNKVTGGSDNPGKLIEKASFSQEEMTFFNKYNIDVMPYHELLKSNNIPLANIERITTSHRAYPHKFIYSCLLSKTYIGKVKNICFFDADIYFQKPIHGIFEELRSGKIVMTAEQAKIGDNPFLREWVLLSDLSFGSNKDMYKERMYASKNICTGFMGGEAGVFNKFMLLCWLLASNNIVSFHSDQSLVNILASYFGYPIHEIGSKHVLHLYGIEDTVSLDAKKRQISYKSEVPCVVHFNGPRKEFIELLDSGSNIAWKTKPYLIRQFQLLAKMLRKIISG